MYPTAEQTPPLLVTWTWTTIEAFVSIADPRADTSQSPPRYVMTSCAPEAITPYSCVESRTFGPDVDGDAGDPDADGDAGRSGMGEPETAGDVVATLEVGGVVEAGGVASVVVD
jgi:hypothetical protein